MKGPIEIYPMIFFGMAFVIIGFSMVEITMKYNNARLYQESIVSTIERQNRYDTDIDNLIKNSEYKCKNCTYKVVKVNDKYLVKVNFNLAIPIINFEQNTQIKSFTQSIV